MNLEKGKVSIIVPVYNAENYLNECISSVIAQSYQCWELLLIDDGSNDGSLEVCKDFSRKDERIKYYSQNNSGPSKARNNGLGHAVGEFVSFLDADDFLLKNSLVTLIDKVKGIDWVIGDYLKVKENHGNIKSGHDLYFKESKKLDKNELYDYLVLYLNQVNKYHLFVHSWGALFRHSIIRKNNIRFNPELTTFEDVDFNFRFLKFVNNVFFVNKIVYQHTLHDNVVSASMNSRGKSENLFGYQAALESAKVLMDNLDLNSKNIRHLGQAHTSYLIIQTIRLVLSINDSNKKEITMFLNKLCRNKILQKNLYYYKAGKNESILLPILFRFKWVWAIINVCAYKSRKRYLTKK